MSLGDSAALVDAGGVADRDDVPLGARLRYRTKKTIATMTATTKTMMRTSVTQPPPEPQCPLPSHIIVGNRLSQPTNQVQWSNIPLQRRDSAVALPAGGASASGRDRLCCRGSCDSGRCVYQPKPPHMPPRPIQPPAP